MDIPFSYVSDEITVSSVGYRKASSVVVLVGDEPNPELMARVANELNKAAERGFRIGLAERKFGLRNNPLAFWRNPWHLWRLT